MKYAVKLVGRAMILQQNAGAGFSDCHCWRNRDRVCDTQCPALEVKSEPAGAFLHCCGRAVGIGARLEALPKTGSGFTVQGAGKSKSEHEQDVGVPGMDDVGGLVKALQREEWLTDWDREFLASVWDKKISRGYRLSEKQMATLKKLRAVAMEQRQPGISRWITRMFRHQHEKGQFD